MGRDLGTSQWRVLPLNKKKGVNHNGIRLSIEINKVFLILRDKSMGVDGNTLTLDYKWMTIKICLVVVPHLKWILLVYRAYSESFSLKSQNVRDLWPLRLNRCTVNICSFYISIFMSAFTIGCMFPRVLCRLTKDGSCKVSL